MKSYEHYEYENQWFLYSFIVTISFIDSLARNNTVLHSKVILGILIAYLLDQFFIFFNIISFLKSKIYFF